MPIQSLSAWLMRFAALDLCRRHALSSAITDKPEQPSLRGVFLARPLL